MKQRWRGRGIGWRGWLYAMVEDRTTGQTLRVYWRLGRWRILGSDEPAPRGTGSIARRLLADADLQGAFLAWREELA